MFKLLRCFSFSLLASLLFATGSATAQSQEIDLTGPVLLLSDAPRQLREACPGLAGAGADCRIERVTARQSGASWLGEAEVKIYRPDGRVDPLLLSARLEPKGCTLVERKVEPSSARAQRLLTMTEMQIALARRDRQGMQAFCLMVDGLLDGVDPPSCLCP